MILLTKKIGEQAYKTYNRIKSIWGQNIVETSEQVRQHGLESNALKDTRTVVARTLSNEDSVVLGYLNKNIVPDLRPGETALYAVNSEGIVQGVIKLNFDHSVNINGKFDNLVRYSELKTQFDQLKSDHNDLVTAFNQHVHICAAPTTPSATPTAVPNVIPASQSTADLEDAKITNTTCSSKTEEQGQNNQ